jgi:protein gp37
VAATSIQWTNHSINPIRFRSGHFCQKISPGCANCYSSTLQKRFRNPEFKGASNCVALAMTNQKTDDALWFDESKLQQVLRRRKPTKYFWCDMTDLFGSWVPDEWIDKCMATMALTPQHTHQVLSKRAERMRDYFLKKNRRSEICRWMNDLMIPSSALKRMQSMAQLSGRRHTELPIPNVWLGVSVEDQQRAVERIPLLIQTPAAVRFLSCEPLLEQIEFRRDWIECQGESGFDPCPIISWVIVGGESGDHARPCKLEWVKDVIKQCEVAGVACFVKQLGARCQIESYANCGTSGEDSCDLPLRDRKGGDMEEWPEDLRIREFPPN